MGPMAVASGSGSFCHTRGPQLYAPWSGDGVPPPSSAAAPAWYHQSCSSRLPHCFLKRCVPTPGEQRPKLKSVSFSAIARSMKAK